MWPEVKVFPAYTEPLSTRSRVLSHKDYRHAEEDVHHTVLKRGTSQKTMFPLHKGPRDGISPPGKGIDEFCFGRKLLYSF